MLGWREIRTDNSDPGKSAVDTVPLIGQVSLTASHESNVDFETQMYLLRKVSTKGIRAVLSLKRGAPRDFYISSLSSRIETYFASPDSVILMPMSAAFMSASKFALGLSEFGLGFGTEAQRWTCCRTVVYEGQLEPNRMTNQNYADLGDERFTSFMGIVHSRLSTTASPGWDRAQPLCMLGQDGEIGTLRGNVNW